MTEKLASQHVLVKRMEKNSSSSHDDVRSEKIVEQQLKIKQVGKVIVTITV